MSNDPGLQLYQLLAESNQRAKSCLQISKSSTGSIEARHQDMLQEMSQLREAIEGAGIGGDLASEDRYLELLQNFRTLHQSHAVAQTLPELPSPAMVDDPGLQKALDYANLMASVYDGQLNKSAQAQADLEQAARHLVQWDNVHAKRAAENLRSL